MNWICFVGPRCDAFPSLTGVEGMVDLSAIEEPKRAEFGELSQRV